MEESHKTHRPHIKVGKDEEKKNASQTFLTVIGLLMQRVSLNRSHHATTVGPIRFSNRSNNCRVCKINERRSSLVRSHHAIFVVSGPTKDENRMVCARFYLHPCFLLVCTVVDFGC